jgi:hypothetical protein
MPTRSSGTSRRQLGSHDRRERRAIRLVDRELESFTLRRDTQEFRQRQQSADLQAPLGPGPECLGVWAPSARGVEPGGPRRPQEHQQRVDEQSAAVELQGQVEPLGLDRGDECRDLADDGLSLRKAGIPG